MSERRIITLSISNLIPLLITGFLLILLWQLRDLLIVVMVAIVIASSLAPVVEIVQKYQIPRWLAVILVYLGLSGILTGVMLIIGPTVIKQIELLVEFLPSYIESLGNLVQNWLVKLGMTEPEALQQLEQFFDLQSLISWGFQTSTELVVRSYGVTTGILGGLFGSILSLLLSGYMLSGSDKLIKGIVSLFPQPWDQRLAAQIKPVSQRMGGYIQGRVLVSAILGIAITIGLKFAGIADFALGLGVIAGVTNLIPFFGPVLGSIPALIVAIAQGGWTFLWVLLLFVIIQNVEAYLLDPLLVGSSVNVAPLYQLLAVLGGTQVLGILGALIVPPWVAGIGVLLENLYLHPKISQEIQLAASMLVSEESNLD